MHQSGNGLVKPGETLTLTCAVSGFDISHSYWAWVRQHPKGELEVIGVGRYFGAKWYPIYTSAFKNRATISTDASTNHFDLQLHFMTAADTAAYYCARDTQ